MNWGRNRADRVRQEFQRTFDTDAGQFVLAWLYEPLHGKQSTFPQSGNPFEMAHNEGMRMAWLLILEQLKEEDIEVRRVYEEYLAEKRKEQMHEQ